MASTSREIYVGIDVGGTAMKGGIVAADGAVLSRKSAPTQADDGPDAVIARISAFIDELVVEARGLGQPAGCVGVGVPGLVRCETGVVHTAPNLPGWREVPLAQRLAELTGLKIIIDNDANNAALGEYAAGIGAGRGLRDMVLLTLGTGIGSGLILGGRVWRGATGLAGEIGHTLIEPGGRPCGCGQRGCLEAYASASSTARRAEEAIRAGRDSSLRPILERAGELESSDVVAEAKSGDALAGQVWSETCRYLAVVCINIQRTLSPQMIAFSGGMSEAGNYLLEGVHRWIDRMASPSFADMAEITTARLGNDAGFIGSALSARSQHEM